jgi:hypothetical protein
MKKSKIQWFARGGDIARCGPFKSQIEATDAMRLIKHEAKTYIAHDCRKGQALLGLVHEPEQRAEFPNNVFVWPEEVLSLPTSTYQPFAVSILTLK